MPVFYQMPLNFNMREKFELKKLKHAEYSLTLNLLRGKAMQAKFVSWSTCRWPSTTNSAASRNNFSLSRA
jgi:hypothetical protein